MLLLELEKLELDLRQQQQEKIEDCEAKDVKINIYKEQTQSLFLEGAGCST